MAEPSEDIRAARALFGEVYLSLAREVDQAGALLAEARRDPARLDDPWVDALIRWRELFDREISDVQKIYAASEAGKLTADEIRVGRETGEELLRILNRARERVPEPA